MRKLPSSVKALCLACLLLGPTISVAATIDEKIEDLQRQLDELKVIQQVQQDQIEDDNEEEQAGIEIVAHEAPAMTDSPEISFGGQYRVNFYSADNDFANPAANNQDNQTASRLRIRQNIDTKFGQQLKTHLQFELGHTTDNVTTTDRRRGGNSTDVSVRHAEIDYTFQTSNLFDGTNARVGLVPLQDFFHQTQFSADWDYNPLAASFTVPIGESSLRMFAANLEEGSESNADDDFLHYQTDVTIPFGGRAGVVLTGTALNIADAVSDSSSWHYNFGLAAHMKLGSITGSGFVIGSSTDRALLGSTRDANGIAALAEINISLGPGDLGILTSYTTGEDDGTGFLPPMAFATTFGYWGYTGILTVQGPTDTGFDFDGVNISNNGYGMSTVQARYTFPVTSALSGYLAAGWFGNTDAGERDSTVGADFLAMGTYRFNKAIALDLGGAFGKLNDSVSGYFQGVQNPGPGGPAFNQALGEDRTKWALFGRIQVEL